MEKEIITDIESLDDKLAGFAKKLDEVKHAEMSYKMRLGQYNEEFGKWLKGEGIPDNFSLLDVIKHFKVKK